MTIAWILLVLWLLAGVLFLLRGGMTGRAALITVMVMLAAFAGTSLAWSLFVTQAPGRAFHDTYTVYAFQELLYGLAAGYGAGFALWAILGRLRRVSPALSGAAFWLFHFGVALSLGPQLLEMAGLEGLRNPRGWGGRLAQVEQFSGYAILAAVLLTALTTLAVLFALATGRGGRR